MNSKMIAMNKYQEAYTSLLLMLSGALREEFIGNEKIQEDLEMLQELIDGYNLLEKALDIASKEYSQLIVHNTKDSELYKKSWLHMAEEILGQESEKE